MKLVSVRSKLRGYYLARLKRITRWSKVLDASVHLRLHGGAYRPRLRDAFATVDLRLPRRLSARQLCAG